MHTYIYTNTCKSTIYWVYFMLLVCTCLRADCLGLGNLLGLVPGKDCLSLSQQPLIAHSSSSRGETYHSHAVIAVQVVTVQVLFRQPCC